MDFAWAHHADTIHEILPDLWLHPSCNMLMYVYLMAYICHQMLMPANVLPEFLSFMTSALLLHLRLSGPIIG